MKRFMAVVLFLAGLGLAGAAQSDEPIMTPDGYLGHPAFEIGINGNPAGNSYTENFSYTNYSTVGTITGNGNFNNNYLFLDIWFPATPTL